MASKQTKINNMRYIDKLKKLIEYYESTLDVIEILKNDRKKEYFEYYSLEKDIEIKISKIKYRIRKVVYSECIFRYTVSLIFPFLKKGLKTNEGICELLVSMHNKGRAENIIMEYPELWNVKPKSFYKGTRYFYKPGRTLPRLIILIRAYFN